MKQIRDFENYTISENGKIYKDNNEISLSTDKDGYLYCILTNNEKRKAVKIHRIIYDTYVKKITSDDIVDHIDKDRKNNIISNLRLVSKRENCTNNSKRCEYHAIDIDTCKVYLFDNPNLFQELFNFTNGNIRKLNNQIANDRFIIGSHNEFIIDKLCYVEEYNYESDLFSFMESLGIEIDYNNTQIKKKLIKKCVYENGKVEYFRSISDFCKNKDFIERNVRDAVSKNKKYKKCEFSKVGLFDTDFLLKVPTTIEN